MATDITPHLLYSEYGNDIEAVDSEYDEVSKVRALVALRLHSPLNNKSEVLYFRQALGTPFPATPTQIITNLYKGESLNCKKEGHDLRVNVNGHNTAVDPNPHPPGTRLTTIETFVIPNVFV
jgi:hypothetical protein